MNHFDENSILTHKQYGFRAGRSCETQLINVLHNLSKALNDKEQLYTILLDFSKAFDKICHRKLCIKLKHYGINGTLLKWIENFLSNRTQLL